MFYLPHKNDCQPLSQAAALIQHFTQDECPPDGGPSTFVFLSLGGRAVVTSPGFAPELFKGNPFFPPERRPPLTSAPLCRHKQEVGTLA